MIKHVSLLALLLMMGCNGSVNSSGNATSPVTEIILSVQGARAAVSLSKALAISKQDAKGCLGLSIAGGVLDEVAATIPLAIEEAKNPDGQISPPPVIVDASACVPLGIPVVIVDSNIKVTVDTILTATDAVVDAAEALACQGDKPTECTVVKIVSAVVTNGSGMFNAIVAGFDTAENGKVTVTVPVVVYPQ